MGETRGDLLKRPGPDAGCRTNQEEEKERKKERKKERNKFRYRYSWRPFSLTQTHQKMKCVYKAENSVFMVSCRMALRIIQGEIKTHWIFVLKCNYGKYIHARFIIFLEPWMCSYNDTLFMKCYLVEDINNTKKETQRISKKWCGQN